MISIKTITAGLLAVTLLQGVLLYADKDDLVKAIKALDTVTVQERLRVERYTPLEYEELMAEADLVVFQKSRKSRTFFQWVLMLGGGALAAYNAWPMILRRTRAAEDALNAKVLDNKVAESEKELDHARKMREDAETLANATTELPKPEEFVEKLGSDDAQGLEKLFVGAFTSLLMSPAQRQGLLNNAQFLEERAQEKFDELHKLLKNKQPYLEKKRWDLGDWALSAVVTGLGAFGVYYGWRAPYVAYNKAQAIAKAVRDAQGQPTI